MTKITINHKNHTIEMSKSAYKAATRFGSEVYEEVQKARAAYPTYKVVEKSVSSKKASEYKGLTYGYMEAYIAKHYAVSVNSLETELGEKEGELIRKYLPPLNT